MGMMNYAVNRLLEREEIFADFFNGTLFDGKEIIHPENLELLSPNAGKVYRDEKGRLQVMERQGDIRMKAEEELYSLILAAEPQDSVHYVMPVRMMEYVTMEYRKQIQDLQKQYKGKGMLRGDEYISGMRKEDKILPVVAVVFFCDSDKAWNGNGSLYDMLQWSEKSEINSEIQKYLPDFKLNIVQANNVGDVSKFKTSLQYIFEMIRYSKDKQGLQDYIDTHREVLNQLDEVEGTATFALLGQQKMVEQLLDDDREQKGEFKMCVALDEMVKDGEMRGIGYGMEKINELIKLLMEAGRVEDLLRSAKDAEYQKRLLQELDIK